MKSQSTQTKEQTKRWTLNETNLIQLIEENKEQFYRIAYSYVNNEQDALDIIQDSVYKAYIAMDQLQSKSYFKTWFIRILINKAIDLVNANKKVIHLSTSDAERFDYPDSKPNQQEQLEMSLDMIQILDQLDPSERLIVTLRFYQDYSLKEIAEITDKPLNTVKSLLYRSLEKLKTIYTKGNKYEN